MAREGDGSLGVRHQCTSIRPRKGRRVGRGCEGERHGRARLGIAPDRNVRVRAVTRHASTGLPPMCTGACDRCGRRECGQRDAEPWTDRERDQRGHDPRTCNDGGISICGLPGGLVFDAVIAVRELERACWPAHHGRLAEDRDAATRAAPRDAQSTLLHLDGQPRHDGQSIERVGAILARADRHFRPTWGISARSEAVTLRARGGTLLAA
jgi:hypothetical protein